MKRTSVLLLVLLLAAACSQPEQPQTTPSALKPSSAHGGAAQPGATGAGALKFTAPEGWISEPPRSGMRRAQYRLPRVAGDSEDAELVVFYFQGTGGGVQANIDRWIDQFAKPDGSPVQDAKSRKKEVNGIPVTLVDVSGTYMAASGPMLSEVQNKPNFRLLGAVAESKAGPWFFKLTGPAKTVAHWEPSFGAFLESLAQ